MKYSFNDEETAARKISSRWSVVRRNCKNNQESLQRFFFWPPHSGAFIVRLYVIISKVKRESIQYVCIIVSICTNINVHKIYFCMHIDCRFIYIFNSNTEPYNKSTRYDLCQNIIRREDALSFLTNWTLRAIQGILRWRQHVRTWCIDMQCWDYKQKYRLDEVCGNTKGYEGILLVPNCAICCWILSNLWESKNIFKQTDLKNRMTWFSQFYIFMWWYHIMLQFVKSSILKSQK